MMTTRLLSEPVVKNERHRLVFAVTSGIVILTLATSVGTFSLIASEDHSLIRATEIRSVQLRRLTEAVKQNPSYSQAYIDIARWHSDIKGNYTEALNFCNRAVSMFPQNPDVLAARGEVYRFLKMHDKAIIDFKTAISLSHSENPDWVQSLESEVLATKSR